MQSKDLSKCIEFAVLKFTENFDHRIKQLLHNFPPEYTNPDGSKFWSGSKRVPTPLVYSAQDPLSAQFVLSYSVLIAQACNININLTEDQIIEYSSKIAIPEFSPRKVIIKVNENDNNAGDINIGQEEEEKLSKLMKDLSIADKAGSGNFKPHEFEKDDDSNHHIDFINSASNLRARNYRIKEVN
jgi:ubiquitin-activating enzyme E1